MDLEEKDEACPRHVSRVANLRKRKERSALSEFEAQSDDSSQSSIPYLDHLSRAHVRDAKVLLILLDEELLVKLLDEVDLPVGQKGVLEGFENAPRLHAEDLEWNVILGFVLVNEQQDAFWREVGGRRKGQKMLWVSARMRKAEATQR